MQLDSSPLLLDRLEHTGERKRERGKEREVIGKARVDSHADALWCCLGFVAHADFHENHRIFF